jgi:DNA-binding IclR family transcriptional regulator
MDNSSQVKTVDRLVDVLDCFTSEQSNWSLGELAGRLDIPKSTLHRFLASLESHGILRRDASRKKWQLGYHLLIWTSLASESSNLREIAQPILRELVESSGETAILTVYDDRKVICIDKCETNQSVRLKMEVGNYRAPHAGASSKILMAYLPPTEVRAIVRENGLPRLCSKTITRQKDLELELARIRDRGYAESLEETDPGAWGIATPIRDWKRQVVGAVGLAGPTTRYSREKVRQYVSLCTRASDKISALLNPAPWLSRPAAAGRRSHENRVAARNNLH